MLKYLLVIIAASTIACEKKTVQINTEQEKIIYAMGVQTASDLSTFIQSDKDLEIYYAGLKDQVQKKPIRFKPAEYLHKMSEVRQAKVEAEVKNQNAESAKYLDEMSKVPGAVKRSSGIIVLSETPGKGKSPKETDKVKIHYVGSLPDGNKFDSTVDRNQPVQFTLASGIPCWNEVLKQMREGGKAKVVCPPKLAYGDEGIPPMIPAGAALTFDIELLEVAAESQKPAAAAPAPAKAAVAPTKTKTAVAPTKTKAAVAPTKTKAKLSKKNAVPTKPKKK